MSRVLRFEIGDTVAYSAAAVQRNSELARRRGTIADFIGNRDWTLAVVEWRDGTLSRVHINNLAHPGANARFCAL